MQCEVPEVELEDGSFSTVLSVTFLDDQTIRPCCVNSKDEEPCVIPCKVTFQSASPVSFSTVLTFDDGREKYVAFHITVNVLTHPVELTKKKTFKSLTGNLNENQLNATLRQYRTGQ